MDYAFPDPAGDSRDRLYTETMFCDIPLSIKLIFDICYMGWWWMVMIFTDYKQ